MLVLYVGFVLAARQHEVLVFHHDISLEDAVELSVELFVRL